jgi:HD-GYP domain-containing protein (c-di-GMP phosphodiesterase class II)
MQALRLAELLAGLSLVADVGMGFEPGEASRAALVAMEVAARDGTAHASDAYYTTLLQHVGCTAYAHEAARLLGGDEIAVKRASVHTDFARPSDVLRTYLPGLAPSACIARRHVTAGTAAVKVRAVVQGYSRANCEVAARTAERVGLGPGVVDGLLDVYEQWDGNGGPQRLRGGAIAQPARIAQVAATAALFHGVAGRPAALAAIRQRAGRPLDPELVELLARRGGEALGVLDGLGDAVTAAVGAEPEPFVTFGHPQAVERVCRAFGEVVDIKTPLHHGHCTGVAALAAVAAERSGLAAEELYRAALVHDLGRASVPNGVWERPGPLGWAEQERMRLHAYHSERVLARCGPLAPVARLAGTHHERLDGSGYHRAETAPGLGPAERLLAAADVMQALTEPRAHRPARSPDEAAALLAGEARSGRLDPDAARAVVEAAGSASQRIQAPRPAGLTARQVEVLRLVARGRSNPEIARELVISRRTAERHVQDVYARIGVSSRAGAALYALEHDLIARDGQVYRCPERDVPGSWRTWNPRPSCVASSTSTRPERTSGRSPSSCTPTCSTTAGRPGWLPGRTACASSSKASAPPSTASARRFSTRSPRVTRS